ncbi:MAG: geranylgeranyl reductase family protein [Asgard group archaeon]|nr:geranylgeranyl reductase family protein [Asgard group archaeon]
MSKDDKSTKIYDVCIVGAGPAGGPCAYYLAKKGYNVLLLDKKKFPRDKVCGDAFPQRAQEHLREMGVLQEIIAENKGRWAALGGLVSPSGIEYYGDSSKDVGDGHLVIAIKRRILDDKVVKKAVSVGVNLVENFNVEEIVFSKETKTWTVSSADNIKKYNAKILVLADGASSRLARKLGLVKTPPQATCSSVYIEVGSHEFKQDGVCYYPKRLVPGYCALFKEADGDLVYCCYIIPGGKATTGDLVELHHSFIKDDPFMSKAVGSNAKMEKMKAAPIRFGGIKQSYSDNLLIIGDAAGHIDPLTGEGLQYAMDGAKIAADTIDEAFKKNKFNKIFLKRYHNRWMRAFGRDFKWSLKMALYLANHPIFLDAFASLSNKKGDIFMIKWGEIMTGSKRKINFFLPNLAFPLLFEVMRLRRKKRQ